MPFPRHRRFRIVVWLGAGLAACVLAAYGARAALADWALRAALHSTGAEDVRLAVREVSPRRVVVEDVDLRLRRQPVTARQVIFARERWWAPNLGQVKVTGLRVPVQVASLRPAPETASSSKSVPAEPVHLPAKVPAEEVSIDGQLVVQAPGLEQALTVKLVAKLQPEGWWAGQMTADGPGVTVRADADYRPETQALTFRVPALHLELQPWQDFIQRVVPAAGVGWNIAGRIDGTAEGTLVAGKSTTTAAVKLRGGSLSSSTQPMMIKGVEAEVVFDDLAQLKTAPGQILRVAELRAGGVTVNDFDAQFAVQGRDRIDVARLSLQMLGGRLTAEPFTYAPSRRELDATVVADSLAIEEVLALAPDVPAQATGRLNGRLPLRFGANGLQFGTGWLGLAPGMAAEVQFNARGLLTRGLSTSNPSYAVLSKIEGGILRLRLGELRLDVHPAGAPEGQSARLHLAGTPVDETVKAPVTLDVNVNGPVERLLNLGLDSRVKIGPLRP